MLAGGTLSYDGNAVELQPGFHVSLVQLTLQEALSSLSVVVPRVARGQAEPKGSIWFRATSGTLQLVHGVLVLLQRSPDAHVPFRDIATMSAEIHTRNQVAASSASDSNTYGPICRKLLQFAPVVVWVAPGRGTIVLAKPTTAQDLRTLAAVAAMWADVQQQQQQQQVSDSIVQQVQLSRTLISTYQDRQILDFAVLRLLRGNKSAAARVLGVQRRTLAHHSEHVLEALEDGLEPLAGEVLHDVQQEAEKWAGKAATLQQEIKAAVDAGLAVSVVQRLQHALECAQRKVAARRPTTEHEQRQYVGLLCTKMKLLRSQHPKLQTAARGHRPSVLSRYPNLKQDVEAVAQQMGGRSSRRRDSVTIVLSKCSYEALSSYLSDPVRMGSKGPIDVSASTLKKLAREGQLDLKGGKVAKIELPTESEQPNAWMLNKVAKELILFIVQNAGEHNATELLHPCSHCTHSRIWHIAVGFFHPQGILCTAANVIATNSSIMPLSHYSKLSFVLSDLQQLQHVSLRCAD